MHTSPQKVTQSCKRLPNPDWIVDSETRVEI